MGSPPSTAIIARTLAGPMGARILAHDWSAAGCGAPADWPAPLRNAIGMILRSGFPMFVVWGPERTLIYNEAYKPILGPREPRALGRPFFAVWPEVAGGIGPVIDLAYAGQSSFFEDREVVLERSGVPEQAWFTFSYSPLLDDDGEVAGALCACVETTHAVQAREIAERERLRQQQIFEQAPGFICTFNGPDHVFGFVNASFRRLFEDRGYVGRSVRDAFPELEGQGYVEMLDKVYATGERFVATQMSMRLRVAGAEDQHRLLDFIYEPMHDDTGRVTGIFCEGFDVTEAYRATLALRESEEQLRLATEVSEVGLWDLNVGADDLFWPARVKAMFGISPDQPISMADFYAGLHPDDREATTEAFAAALDPARRAFYDVEYRTIGKEDGQLRWVAAKGRGIFNDQGECIRVLGTALDITRRKLAEEHLRLMVNELNHRVKNSLATVQAITTQTLRHAEIPLDVRDTLTARLVALAQAHDVLTDERWSGADLREIAEQAAAPYGGLGPGRPFAIDGPSLYLPPRTAIAIALAFHELATNAAKYGSLSVESGGVHIRWCVAHEAAGRRLDLTWSERGGPAPTRPSRTGFGTRLIERALAAELNGAVSLDYAPTGVVCTMQAVLAEEPQAAWEVDLQLT